MLSDGSPGGRDAGSECAPAHRSDCYFRAWRRPPSPHPSSREDPDDWDPEPVPLPRGPPPRTKPISAAGPYRGPVPPPTPHPRRFRRPNPSAGPQHLPSGRTRTTNRPLKSVQLPGRLESEEGRPCYARLSPLGLPRHEHTASQTEDARSRLRRGHWASRPAELGRESRPSSPPTSPSSHHP